MEHLINKLKTALQQPLPGQEAQYRMAPLHRERIETAALAPGQYRLSAVMVLICTDMQDNLFIPLTERMAYSGVHSAQISLPGGKFEEQDENLMNTAIRECSEEIGVKEVEVIGKLTRLAIPVSNFLVHPFIGISKHKNPIMMNHEREVKSILKFKIADLLNEATVKNGSITVLDNVKIKTPYFEVENHKVWGATAMILNELKELIRIIS